MKAVRAGLICLTLLGAGLPALAESRNLAEINGDYLFYSFDYNYIYGRGNIRFVSGGLSIESQSLELDIKDRNAFFSGDCRVKIGENSFAADCLDLELQSGAVRLFSHGEEIASSVQPPAAAATAFNEFVPISLQELKKSFVFYVGRRFEVRRNYSVFGYMVTIFIEGMQSVTFRRFRLDKGVREENKQLFSFDKLSYASATGLMGAGSINLQKKGKKTTFTHTTSLEGQYDLFGIQGVVPRSRLYFSSRQEWKLSQALSLRSDASWITQNMARGSLSAEQRVGKFMTNLWLLEYNKPYRQKDELWLRLRSNMPLKAVGTFNFNYSYERHGQNLLDLSYDNQFFKKLNLNLRHNQSKLVLDGEPVNRQSNSTATLSYSAKLFNLSADFSLNRDLLHDQSQANPSLRLQVMPVKFYGGLLHLNFNSTAMFSIMRRGDWREDLFRNNSTFSLETEKFKLFRETEISASLAVEQYLDKDPTGRYTTLGYIFRGRQRLWQAAFLEFIYNYQTRRETARWFIQGTHSQDCNLIFRLDESRQLRVNGWASVSVDTKLSRFTTGYFDLTVLLLKNWRFQTQINYDFIFRNLNYDLFLMRKAGRIMLRLSYRSISKAFLIDIVPQ